MRSTTLHMRRLRAAAALVWMATLFTASGGTLVAQSNSSQAGLTGAWVVQVTLRDCATSNPQGTFRSLVTFHRGGTITESPGSLTFAPGQRSAGHGTWTHQGGRSYRQRTIALTVFGSPANLPGMPDFDPGLPVAPAIFPGWQVIDHLVRMTGVDQFTSAGTATFFNSSGETYNTGCSTATAQRFK